MSSAWLAKSSTRTSSTDFSGWMRLSRDSVCTAATPVSGLSTYIPHSSGWSKPVWYLSATTRIRYSSCFREAAAGSSSLHVSELVRQLPLGEPVELRLAVLKIGMLVLQRPGERHEHTEAAAGQVAVKLADRLVQVERVLPPRGHHHGLRPPGEPPGDVVTEVLDDQPALLRHRRRVPFGEAHQLRLRLPLVHLRVRRRGRGLLDRGVPQPPLGVIGEVVREHVEDVALLDRLPHRVNVEWHVHAQFAGLARVRRGRVEDAEQLERRRLRRRGEREVRQVRLRPAHPCQVGGRVLVLIVASGGVGAERLLEPRRGVPALRGVRLVDDHRVPLVPKTSVRDLPEHERVELERADDDLRRGVLKGLRELT